MHLKLTALSFLPLFASLCIAQGIQDAPLSQRLGNPLHTPAIHITSWSAPNVQHVYGLPETKAKAKGTLTINDAGLTFVSNSGRNTIPWSSTVAVSNGSERVEMFGATGTIMRMMIPDGGGLAAASVMHHRVYNLTVEFHDPRGAYHAAVFALPGSDAPRVLDSYKQAVPPAKDNLSTAGLPQTSTAPACGAKADLSRSVLIAEPNWSGADVPAAYRALVYEHIVNRMQNVKEVGHVYRTELGSPPAACPQHTVTISVVSFKPGSQVKRATMGPIGFFAGTTQMAVRANITDASGRLNVTDQIKVTVRGESQSQNLADGVATKLAKYYASSIKQYEKNRSADAPRDPSSL
jgi:hypothetical protein